MASLSSIRQTWVTRFDVQTRTFANGYTSNLRVNVTRVLERFGLSIESFVFLGYEALCHLVTIPLARHLQWFCTWIHLG